MTSRNGRKLSAAELCSPTVLEEIGEGAVPLGVVMAISLIDADGRPQIQSLWDDDTAFFAVEGMVRNLLRDVIAEVDVMTWARAAQQIEDDGGDEEPNSPSDT